MWMHTDGVIRILAALKKGGGTVRFVGGAVRDALAGREVGEIDFACDLPPPTTMDLLTAAGIKTAPTGLEHGTVTAIADHKGYEITTLRHDVETYGRKAKVAFTDDWQQDAARRDFTINALYADEAGTLYDYFNGREDLALGRVRFIGAATDRIQEDVLRILRFFRFYAWFGKTEMDSEGLHACARLAHLLPQLSAERIWREIGKLLSAENPAPSWRLMITEKILSPFLPEAGNVVRLEKLGVAERRYEAPIQALVRLAALLPPDEDVAERVAQKFKMANREREHLRLLTMLPARLRGKLDPIPFRRALYEYGADACRAAALLLAADEPGADLEDALAIAADWQKPVFPLQGEDLLALGLKPGPRVGEILRKVEEWWGAQDFKPTRRECLAEAERLRNS
jgi:poly(A) polymerase